MAVDFGWPWWAFTTIALVVAAASLLLLRLVSSRLAHGVLLTLLVEAVTISALAPAVMIRSHPMSHEPGRTHPTHTDTPNTGMSNK
jgi:hypothetical protein